MTSAAQNITQLFYGSNPNNKWPGATITYTFLTEQPLYPTDYHPPGGPIPLSAAQQQATRDLFAYVQQYLNVQFVEVTQDNSQNQIGQIAKGMAPLPNNWVGTTNSNLGAGSGGDIWLNSPSYDTGQVTVGFLDTMLHEIGHALGLDHPTAFGGIERTTRYTMMSYDTGGLNVPTTTLQLYDISALQELYGAAETRNSGDSTYLYGSSHVVDSIWDTGGNDTLSAEGASTGAWLNLNDTKFSTIGTWSGFLPDEPAKNISIAKNVEIENAIGTDYTDVIIGNELSNKLSNKLEGVEKHRRKDRYASQNRTRLAALVFG